MKCKICESGLVRQVGSLPLYSTLGDYDTNIFKCNNCGVFYRDFDYSNRQKMKKHFAMSTYTDIQLEPSWRSQRSRFFKNIVNISNHYVDLSSETKVLDFGCSYGHLLEKYSKHGVSCYGLELHDALRQRLKGRFSGIYESFAQLPKDVVFNVITFIDSLYLVEDPIAILQEAKSRLHKDGIIVIRNTNRALLLNLICRFSAKLSNEIFGDAKYNYSQKGIEVVFKKSGLRTDKTILHEKGRYLGSMKRKFMYYIPLMISLFASVRITPGVIHVIRHR